MEVETKEEFSLLWKKYFSNAELPVTFYYTNEEGMPSWLTLNQYPDV